MTGSGSGAWLGPIFIRDEGGFEIIMRALNHYNRRLHRISGSPEVSDGGASAALGSILQSESMRVASKLKPIADRLRAGLTDAAELAALEGDVETIERAMVCYRSDIAKAVSGVHEYYSKLLDGNANYLDDVGLLEESVRKLKQYA